MKKVIFMILLIGLLVNLIYANSKIGFIIGSDVSYVVDNADYQTNIYMPGFKIGANYKVNLIDNVYFDSSIMYTYYQLSFDNKDRNYVPFDKDFITQGVSIDVLTLIGYSLFSGNNYDFELNAGVNSRIRLHQRLVYERLQTLNPLSYDCLFEESGNLPAALYGSFMFGFRFDYESAFIRILYEFNTSAYINNIARYDSINLVIGYVFM